MEIWSCWDNVSVDNIHREMHVIAKLTEGPTFPWGPASPGRPVRPWGGAKEQRSLRVNLSTKTVWTLSVWCSSHFGPGQMSYPHLKIHFKNKLAIKKATVHRRREKMSANWFLRVKFCFFLSHFDAFAFILVETLALILVELLVAPLLYCISSYNIKLDADMAVDHCSVQVPWTLFY